MVPVVWLALVAGELLINEVLYDPAGPDGDSEYVELFNPGDAPVALDGYSLLFLNAGDPDGARAVWTAAPGGLVAPGGFHVVGEAAVVGADEVDDLDLQNGPDALWLVREGERVDAVAWGDGAGQGGEGTVAADVADAPIGRVPDGADRDDNGTDFRRLPRPTPGGVNLPATWFEASAGTIDPPWRADAGPVLWNVHWIARGWSDRHSAELNAGGGRRRFEAAAGDTVTLAVTLELGVGPHDLVVEGWADAPGFAGADTLRVQVGTASVRLTEIQPRPATGEPEWVEILVTGPVDLSPWSIADSGSARRVGDVGPIAAGSRILLTSDPDGLRAFHGLDPSVVVRRPDGGWPTLNDGSPGDPDPADAFRLFDGDGRLLDRATYRRDELGDRGRSLQRTTVVRDGASVWVLAAGPPTPGVAHAMESYRIDDPVLSVGPDPFSPDGDGREDLLQIVLETPGATPIAQVRDLWGDLVVELDGAAGPDRAHWQWDGLDADGRPVPVGAYVVWVRADADEGGARAWRRVFGLGRRP